jgi:hypothetical protein
MHILNEDAVMAEVDELPAAQSTLIAVKNPRRKDGKDLPYLEAGVTHVMWSINRINFIEVIPTGEDEDIIGFVRE